MLFYLTVSHTEEGQTISNTSPLFIKKDFESVCGNQLQLEICVMGALLVKASYDMQSRKFLEDEFVIRSGFCGSFESHATLNSSKGMIYCR